MSDALQSGQRFRSLNVIDEFNRECLAIRVEYSINSLKVIETLENIAVLRGYPKQIRLDNGPENLSLAFKRWAQEKQIRLSFIQPGKPAQNAYIERFNKSYRVEILDHYLFSIPIIPQKPVHEPLKFW